MGAVKAWIMDIEEELIDVVCKNEIVTDECIKKIAEKCGATVHVVKEVYEEMQKEYYEW